MSGNASTVMVMVRQPLPKELLQLRQELVARGKLDYDAEELRAFGLAADNLPAQVEVQEGGGEGHQNLGC